MTRALAILLLSAAFVARSDDLIYFRDEAAMQNNPPFPGLFEVALYHWPEVPNLRVVVRRLDRARPPAAG